MDVVLLMVVVVHAVVWWREAWVDEGKGCDSMYLQLQHVGGALWRAKLLYDECRAGE